MLGNFITAGNKATTVPHNVSLKQIEYLLCRNWHFHTHWQFKIYICPEGEKEKERKTIGEQVRAIIADGDYVYEIIYVGLVLEAEVGIWIDIALSKRLMKSETIKIYTIKLFIYSNMHFI